MNKKVYINRKPVLGPWGGGNKFVTILAEYLEKLNYNVVYELSHDVDIIFCFDPRPNSEGIWYQDFINHKVKHGSKIIQRVGDVGTHSKPDLNLLVKESTKISDYVIFPSKWSKNKIGFEKDNFSIIHNAPLPIFYNHKNKINSKKLKLVTHHWSTNEKKGFNIYEYLGEAISKELIENIEFTFIGRYNHSYSSNGINLVKPMDELNLSLVLPKYDLYLTASLEEAGANHVLEAMACGLPVLYRSGGGSINEYCKNHGIEYDSKEKLLEILRIISKSKIPTKKYNNTITESIKEYEKIICKI